MGYVTGSAIKDLRMKRDVTQKQLADQVGVSDKTVSKWETGRGLPDISLIEPLARALNISVAELLSGECAENTNRSGNMLHAGFCVCPVCGNVVFSTGQGAFSCHGITLPRLGADKPNDAHAVDIRTIDGEYHVSIDHPMTKEHFISFIAYVTSANVQIEKLYPEQDAMTRFRINGTGRIYAFCNHHGLFTVACKQQPSPNGRRLP